MKQTRKDKKKKEDAKRTRKPGRKKTKKARAREGCEMVNKRRIKMDKQEK